MTRWLVLLLFVAATANAERSEALYATALTEYFCLYDTTDPTDMEVSASFAAGDVTVTIDGGTPANSTNLPADEGNCYSLALTAAELTGKTISVEIIDQTVSKDFLDHEIIIETYGNSSARHDWWAMTCEDQGDVYTCREVMSLLLAEAMGTCVYADTTRTWVCSDPSGAETRFTLVYGSELDGDRTTSTPAPMTQ